MTHVDRTARAGIVRQAFDEAYDLCIGGNFHRAGEVLNRAYGNAAQKQADHVYESIVAVAGAVRNAMWDEAKAEDEAWTYKRLSELVPDRGIMEVTPL